MLARNIHLNTDYLLWHRGQHNRTTASFETASIDWIHPESDLSLPPSCRLNNDLETYLSAHLLLWLSRIKCILFFFPQRQSNNWACLLIDGKVAGAFILEIHLFVGMEPWIKTAHWIRHLSPAWPRGHCSVITPHFHKSQVVTCQPAQCGPPQMTPCKTVTCWPLLLMLSGGCWQWKQLLCRLPWVRPPLFPLLLPPSTSPLIPGGVTRSPFPDLIRPVEDLLPSNHWPLWKWHSVIQSFRLFHVCVHVCMV